MSACIVEYISGPSEVWLVGWWVEWFVYEWWIEMRLQDLDLCEEDLAQPLTPLLGSEFGS